MKVDLGQCAVCGAKNSKYVENCYKCGATLPWAPGYIAPKNSPQPAKPQPQQPAAPDNAKTVVVTPTVVTPTDAQPVEPTPTVAPASETKPSVSQRAGSKVAVPTWALFSGGLGLLVLGMGLWALLSPKPVATPAIIAPTPVATTVATSAALAPIAPAASATPAGTPAQSPTSAATPIAGATDAAPAATTVPAAPPQTEATEAPVTGVMPEPAIGPTFDELYANLTTGTPQQQTLYWESVKGRKINWRGEFVSLGNAASGPLVVNCKTAKGALKVTVNLDETTPQTLPQFTARQSVPFSGILQSRDAAGIAVSGGRAG